MKRILLTVLAFAMIGMLSVKADGLTTSMSLTPFDQVTTSIADDESMELSVYPNPSIGNVTVTSVDVITSIKVMNSIGQTIYAISNVNAFETIVELDGLEKGIYIIIVNDETVKKVIKQ